MRPAGKEVRFLLGVTQYATPKGRVAERMKAAVLKTADVKASVGSNPTPSARLKSEERLWLYSWPDKARKRGSYVPFARRSSLNCQYDPATR